MIRLFNTISILVFCCSLSFAGVSREYTLEKRVMGSSFYITIIHDDSTQAYQYLEEVFELADQVENEISSWKKTSVTSAVNQAAGERPVKVTLDLFRLIRRSLFISKLTDGMFDISYASLDKVWYFHKKMQRFPTSQQIDSLRQVVDYKKIILNEKDTTVFLAEKGMKIGFGAIGKGYVANKIKAYLVAKGIQSGIVNAGGDLCAWGKNINGENWSIAIADPREKNKILAHLSIENEAIVTSGDYERFFYHNGKKYTHIINPKTGMPTEGVHSVTVICPDTELADALATSIFMMKPKEGIRFVNGLKQVECLIIDDNFNIYTSEQINLINDEK